MLDQWTCFKRRQASRGPLLAEQLRLNLFKVSALSKTGLVRGYMIKSLVTTRILR
jgi:hypothetical protein